MFCSLCCYSRFGWTHYLSITDDARVELKTLRLYSNVDLSGYLLRLWICSLFWGAEVSRQMALVLLLSCCHPASCFCQLTLCSSPSELWLRGEERPGSQTPLVILGAELGGAVVVRARWHRARGHRGQSEGGWGGFCCPEVQSTVRLTPSSLPSHCCSDLMETGRVLLLVSPWWVWCREKSQGRFIQKAQLKTSWEKGFTVKCSTETPRIKSNNYMNTKNKIPKQNGSFGG